MQCDNTGKFPPAESSGDSIELRVLSAKEALRRDLKALEVPPGVHLMFSPYEPEFADYFVRVEVKDFGDLKTLGFVPRGLAEEKVRRAIADDDAEAYKIAHTRLANSGDRGGCDCQQPPINKTPAYNLRQHYENARRRFNPSLSSVISEHLQAPVDWDSPVASIVRSWTRYVDARLHAAIVVALISDITIDRGAILRVDMSTKSLLAGTIWIHRTGRLVSDGGYLKIWARAISSFTLKGTDSTTLETIPWLVHN